MQTDPLASGTGKVHADTLTRAAERAQAVQATLVRGDGEPRYGPNEQRERHAATLAAFDAETARVTIAAETARADAETALTRLDGADPLTALPEPELRRAAALGPFIAEEAARLPLGVVTQRLRAVLAGDDRTARTLWHRYAATRLDALKQGTGPSAPLPERVAFADAVAAVAAAVTDPRAATEREDAQRRIATARAVTSRAQSLRRILDGTDAADLARARRRYAGVL